MINTNRVELHDDYLVSQQRALAEAVESDGGAGEGGRSYRLAEHLAAEGGVHRGDVLAATTLFLAYTAFREGNIDAAQGFARRLRGLDPSSVELVIHLMRLEVGREQGWLPRAQYDDLLAYAWRENRFDLAQRAGDIQARDVDPGAAPVGWWAELERNLCPLLA
ncbi:hypothetical protein VSH64_28620 [Amycolatopsis rhabdoformis]|uniref:Tetratricopeptide repeat protein n=1 Tax=Amycolatopsis rhabdoformis TaxID=1448059 RepID=A0ABZ1HZ62_9PSEU|nr:hypothetical protein [Amycolatopsis rhabdoformis]WSE26838.1 hypothetical protein VSH64_28620 [Amycolatopsis rhabdoformis]